MKKIETQVNPWSTLKINSDLKEVIKYPRVLSSPSEFVLQDSVSRTIFSGVCLKCKYIDEFSFSMRLSTPICESNLNLEQLENFVMRYGSCQSRWIEGEKSVFRKENMEQTIDKVIEYVEVNLSKKGNRSLLISKNDVLNKLNHMMTLFPITNSIDHGDLHIHNLVELDSQYYAIDWEKVRITHPFLSLSHLIISLNLINFRLNNNSIDSYLSNWSHFADFPDLKRLLNSFILAVPLIYSYYYSIWSSSESFVDINTSYDSSFLLNLNTQNLIYP